MRKNKKTKQRLINAARVIFAKFGFEKATMDDIAIEAGKGKSSIYYYYESKEDIFNAVVEYEAEILKEKLLSAIKSSNNVFDKFRNYIIVRFHGIKELGNLYNALRNDLLKNLEFIQKARAKYDELELYYIKSMIEEGNREKVFNVSNINNTAGAIHLTIKSIELPLLLAYQAKELEEKLSSLIDLLFYGLASRNTE